MIYDVLPGPELSLKDVLVGFNDEITDLKFCTRRRRQQVFDFATE